MIVVLVVIAAAVVAGGGLLVAMLRRDEPHLGVWALTALLAASVLAVVYAATDA